MAYLRQSLFLLCAAFPVLAAPDWSTLNRGIVRVEAAKKPVSETGAGIVIAASADSIRILAAAHVVAGATAWKVYFYADKRVAYTATLLPGSSDGLDLAVLEVRPQGRALPSNLPRLAMRDRITPPVDERIWTIDSHGAHIANTVVRLDHDSDTRLFEYTRAPAEDGFAGGPVFDDLGRLAGIRRGGGTRLDRNAVAVKLDSAMYALAAPGQGSTEPPKPVASGPLAGDTRVNAVDGLTYVWIPPGNFKMGCTKGDTECGNDEWFPVVQIANGFWLGQTEVTQAAWKKLNGGGNPSHFKGDRLPVENVDWNQAGDYCKAIGGRLPTEKEWEYAARAGATGPRYGALDAVAWYVKNSGATTHPVGLKQANAWGVYDMLGNVWEWTSDNYDYKFRDKALRGGSWLDDSWNVRVSLRAGLEPAARNDDVGFRCVGEFR